MHCASVSPFLFFGSLTFCTACALTGCQRSTAGKALNITPAQTDLATPTPSQAPEAPPETAGTFDLAQALLDATPNQTEITKAETLKALEALAVQVRAALPLEADGIDYCDALYEVVLDRRTAEPIREDRAEDYDLTQIVKRRRGSCLAMGMLVLAVARRVPAPLYGAQCTGHFFLKCTPPKGLGLNFDVANPTPDNWRKLDDDYFRSTYHFDKKAEVSGAYLRPLTDCETLSAFLASRAGFLSLQQKFEDAQRDAQRAIALNVRNVTAWLNAGFASEKTGQLEQAAEQYQQALKLDPQSVRALNNLAYLRICDPHSAVFAPKQAAKLIERAIELQPRKAYLRATQGEVYAAQKDWREAARALQDAQRLEPKNKQYHTRFLQLRAELRGEK